MKTNIRLTDCASLAVWHGEEWPSHVLRHARTSLERAGLRFSNKTGTIRTDEDGVKETYCNPGDFIPHKSLEAVMKWEFSRWINNSCSRLSRGHSAT